MKYAGSAATWHEGGFRGVAWQVLEASKSESNTIVTKEKLELLEHRLEEAKFYKSLGLHNGSASRWQAAHEGCSKVPEPQTLNPKP